MHDIVYMIGMIIMHVSPGYSASPLPCHEAANGPRPRGPRDPAAPWTRTPCCWPWSAKASPRMAQQC